MRHFKKRGLPPPFENERTVLAAYFLACICYLTSISAQDKLFLYVNDLSNPPPPQKKKKKKKGVFWGGVCFFFEIKS